MKKGPVLWALGILSAATLALEIDLSRLLAVSQFYHLSFMVVSLALLGFGASGTLLTLWPRLRTYDARRVLGWLGWGLAVSTVAVHLLMVYLPFDSFSVAVDRRQWAVLALHYLVTSTPFACAGLAVGLLLATYPEQGSSVYAANLVGSAVGCVLAVLLPAWVGGEGVVALAAASRALEAVAASRGTPGCALGAGGGRRACASLVRAAALSLQRSQLRFALPGRAAHLPTLEQHLTGRRGAFEQRAQPARQRLCLRASAARAARPHRRRRQPVADQPRCARLDRRAFHGLPVDGPALPACSWGAGAGPGAGGRV
jgi:hypothetical protein